MCETIRLGDLGDAKCEDAFVKTARGRYQPCQTSLYYRFEQTTPQTTTWHQHTSAWQTACGLSDNDLSAACLSPRKGVQLWGERHSGTNEAQSLLSLNFQLERAEPFQYGFKHMFSKSDGTSFSNADDFVSHWRHRLLQPPRDGMATLIMVREPFQWLISMHRVPYHMDHLKRTTLDEFVRARWFGHDASGLVQRQALTGEAFSNILELRTTKLRLLHHVFEASHSDPSLAPVLIVREEDVVRDQIDVVCQLASTARLCPARPSIQAAPCQPTRKKKCPTPPSAYTLPSAPLHYEGNLSVSFSAATISWIMQQLDWKLERVFGYSPPPRLELDVTPRALEGQA